MTRDRTAIRTFFASIALLFVWAQTAAAQTDREVEALSKALEAMRAGDWTLALASAETAGPIARDIIEWQRLRAGNGKFDEVKEFLARRSDWPGLKLLRRRSEGALPFGTRSQEVVAFFAAQPPQTGPGSVALAAAFDNMGKQGDAQAQVVLAWLSQPLAGSDETYLLKRYGALLKTYHTERLDMLLWRGERKAAERLYPLVSEGWRKLAKARLALRDNKPGVDGLIEAVPKSLQNDPGLIFERFQWRARKGRNAAAVELALTREGTNESLGQPARWAGWRRALARWAMREDDPRAAYRLASQHGLSAGASYADLEWLSGYIALRRLNDPALALRHFQRFRLAVRTPISMGRAGYWEGRAHEALGDPEAAQVAYEFGGEFQTSFYGLLAAERAGFGMDPSLTGAVDYPDWRGASFADSSVLKAALLLQRAEERTLANRFFVQLAETLEEPELGQIADLALSLDEPYIAVMIAKTAAQRGVVLPKAYFPVVDLGVADLPVSAELALAIARRESEFNPAVKSGMGARGLMQLMPRTAREIAGQLEMKFDAALLIDDPAYNATLGTAYLAGLIEEFGANMVLVAAGYNAGPSRPRRWMEERGDPRRNEVDVVDWIESIPFRETRNYVMRVTESLPVYRARLSGRTEPIRFSRELAAR